MERAISGCCPVKRPARLALLLVLWAPVATAQITEATSTTLLRLEPVWLAGDSRTTYSATEFVNVSMRAIDLPGVQDLRLQVSAWATGALVSSGPDGLLIGDVQLMTLSGSLFDHHLNLTVGRQLVTGGAARALQLDGLNAIDSDTARMSFTEAGKPALLTGKPAPDEQPDYRYLLMPVRVP